MTGCEFGDVLLVPFPFTDQPIAQWKEAGLLRPSVFKPLLATIEHGLVLRKLGRLAEEDRAALRQVLDQILGA